MTKLKLYSYFRSSASYRVRLAMEVLQIDYDLQPIHLLNNGGEQKSKTYRDLNPSEQVPTLVDGDFVLGQSLPIILYLEQKYGPKLLLENQNDQFLQMQFCEIINCTQPLQNLSTIEFLTRELGVNDPQKSLWLKKWIQNGFAACELLLEKHSQLCSPEPNLIDCFLLPQLYSAHRFLVDLEPFPLARNRQKYLNSFQSLQNAHPHFQPDTPLELQGKF